MIETRQYEGQNDYWAISAFLKRHHQPGNADGNWLEPAWEYMHFLYGDPQVGPATELRYVQMGRQVSRWHPYRDAFLGEVEPPDDFGRPVHCYVKRRPKENGFVHSYYISSLPIDAKGR
jgi:anaerobic selenocysteine-containing dehydrogenase